MKLKLAFAVCLLLFAACGPKRNLVYFSEGNPKISIALPAIMEIKIQADDILKIFVTTLSAESNILLNPSASVIGYRVDKGGNINFPIIGLIKVDGLTIEQAQIKISREVEKYAKNPNVAVQFLNFKITVIGEVNRPSSFTITDNRINVLEALGLAGDMTIYGKRENVLVIRQNGNERTMARINMNNRDVLNSPFFNLKQNDIVYVEPDRAKAASVSEYNRYLPVIISAAISVAAVFFQFYYGR